MITSVGTNWVDGGHTNAGLVGCRPFVIVTSLHLAMKHVHFYRFAGPWGPNLSSSLLLQSAVHKVNNTPCTIAIHACVHAHMHAYTCALSSQHQVSND